jgi:hypothetical protein
MDESGHCAVTSGPLAGELPLARIRYQIAFGEHQHKRRTTTQSNTCFKISARRNDLNRW